MATLQVVGQVESLMILLKILASGRAIAVMDAFNTQMGTFSGPIAGVLRLLRTTRVMVAAPTLWNLNLSSSGMWGFEGSFGLGFGKDSRSFSTFDAKNSAAAVAACPAVVQPSGK